MALHTDKGLLFAGGAKKLPRGFAESPRKSNDLVYIQCSMILHLCIIKSLKKPLPLLKAAIFSWRSQTVKWRVASEIAKNSDYHTKKGGGGENRWCSFQFDCTDKKIHENGFASFSERDRCENSFALDCCDGEIFFCVFLFCFESTIRTIQSFHLAERRRGKAQGEQSSKHSSWRLKFSAYAGNWKQMWWISVWVPRSTFLKSTIEKQVGNKHHESASHKDKAKETESNKARNQNWKKWLSLMAKTKKLGASCKKNKTKKKHQRVYALKISDNHAPKNYQERSLKNIGAILQINCENTQSLDWCLKQSHEWNKVPWHHGIWLNLTSPFLTLIAPRCLPLSLTAKCRLEECFSLLTKMPLQMTDVQSNITIAFGLKQSARWRQIDYFVKKLKHQNTKNRVLCFMFEGNCDTTAAGCKLAQLPSLC